MFYVLLGLPFFVLGILAALVGGFWFYVTMIVWVLFFSDNYEEWVCLKHHTKSLSWGKSLLLGIASFGLGVLVVISFVILTL